MFQISTTHCHFFKLFGDKVSLLKIKECGFDGVDFSFNAYQTAESLGLEPDGLPYSVEEGATSIIEETEDKMFEYFSGLRAYCEEIGLKIAVAHAPYYNYAPDLRENPELFCSEKYINIYKNIVKATAFLGCKYLVVHPILLPDPENSFFKTMELNIAFFNELKETMAKYDVNVAVENMDAINPLKTTGVPCVFSSGEKINYLLSRLDDERFCACLDTGHAFLSGQEPAHMARILGDNLKVLHLQDSDGNDDLHIPPTCGNIDWADFWKALKEIGFKGELNFEVNYLRTTQSTETICAMGSFLSALGREFSKKIK